MVLPTIPTNEADRLQSLNSYNILDTLPEREYDDFTQIAAQICDVPIALISLIDKDRQWFKSRKGLEAPQTPRDYAFCAHAINEPDKLFEVKDSTKDPRFADNPLVTGDPRVIFYTGSPLVTPSGHAIGTLCVIDNKPREISQEAKDALQILGRQVVTTLELRKKNSDLGTINIRLNFEIEKRREKERELKRARDRALEAEKMKDACITNISDKISPSIEKIVGCAHQLLTAQNLTPEQLEWARCIEASIQQLSQVIEDKTASAYVR